ncbi:MAG: hypothetical protein R3B09_01205 [Nannocystaceae bacterium]
MAPPRRLFNRAAPLALFLVAAVVGACGGDDPSPRERCESEGKGECCDDDACAAGSICDFDYVCSPAPGGEVQCGEPSGDRACHVTCSEDQEGDACSGGGSCTRIERFAGGDAGEARYACF